jgi:hypothetical protein
VSDPRQADRPNLVHARLECGRCGRPLARLAADPDDPMLGALPRLWGPGNPSQRVTRSARDHRDSYLPAVTPVHPGEYRHRYRCIPTCREDFQSGSYRLGLAIVAKAAGRRSVRLVTGVDV